eukprot:7985568-Pyramimonas_sp.AAC.1
MFPRVEKNGMLEFLFLQIHPMLMFARRPREASQQTVARIQKTSNPQPRHGNLKKKSPKVWSCPGRLFGSLGAFLPRLGDVYGSLFGGLGAVLGASSAVLQRWKHEIVRRPTIFQQHTKMNGFRLSGRSQEASRSSLEVAWRPPGSLESRPKA